MINISDKVKCMASLATFRKMLKDNKSIYDVIGQLAGQIIVEKSIHDIDVASLRDLINKEAGIEVPSSIVKASMRRVKFVTLDNFQVTTNEQLTQQLRDEIIEQIELGKEQDRQVYNALIAFVEGKMQRTLNDVERENLIKDFCSFIVNDSYHLKFSSYVSNFFLSKQGEKDFLEQMSKIREGMIILLGLAYNVKEDRVDLLDRPLCLYLETEVLFNMAGYNGELAKELFDEFYAQVSAINSKFSKPLVRLLYFEETLNEVERYFNTAKDIVEKRTRLDLSKMAMKTIVTGCCEKYEVIEKFGAFKKLLQDKNIELDQQRNYYDKENALRNIDQDRIVFETANEEYSEEKVSDKINLVYYIYIKRGQKSHEIFNNVGHILVSGNSLTFKVSCHEEFGQKVKDVPLVWGTERLTSRLWQMLNKGIMPSGRLKSMDLLAKSRLILASKVNSSIERLYRDIEDQIREGRLTEEDAKIGVIELRTNCVTADDINETDADSYQAIIDEVSVENIIAESKARQRRQEEVIDRQTSKIHEQQTVISSAAATKSEAIKRLLKHENDVLKRRYDKESEEYTETMTSYVNKEMRSRCLKNITIFAIYFLIIVGLFIFANITCFGNKWIKNIIAFVVFVIPFIRPLFNHIPVKNACLFILCNKTRKMAKEEMIEEYKKKHLQPRLIQKTEADIENEIMAEIK